MILLPVNSATGPKSPETPLVRGSSHSQRRGAMDHYRHPDVIHARHQVIGRVVVMVLVWVTAFVWCIAGD